MECCAIHEGGKGSSPFMATIDKQSINRKMDDTSKLPDLPQPVEVPDFLEDDNWFQEDVSGLYLDFAEVYVPPRWTLSHKGVPFANLGELHVVTGKSGHGKTALMSQLMAAILCGECGGINCELNEAVVKQPRVLYIDTEQGKDDTIAIKNRVCVMAGMDYSQPTDRFIIARLRETEDATERWRQILKIIYETHPTVCFLDGMLDIVNDYNDQKECAPIIRKCMKLATHYDMSMWCVLHENPTFEKMVGSLGSITQRKVTEVFAVRKHKNEQGKDHKANRPDIYFTVTQLKARGRDVGDWDFEFVSNANGWGMPRELPDEDGDVKFHEPRELKEWITKKQGDVTWPATRRDIYNMFGECGVVDLEEQKAALTTALNARLLLEQEKAEGQRNARIIINRELIPF